MPFLAYAGSDLVSARTVEGENRDRSFTCPYCADSVAYRTGALDDMGDYTRVRRSHFYHPGGGGGASSGSGGCAAGGESPEHETGKLLAVDALQSLVDQYGGRLDVEHPIGHHQADVAYTRPSVSLAEANQQLRRSPPSDAVAFTELLAGHPLGRYGRGIAVELQYRNTSKDYFETTADYLSWGYSVLWLFNDEQEHYRIKREFREWSAVSEVTFGRWLTDDEALDDEGYPDSDQSRITFAEPYRLWASQFCCHACGEEMDAAAITQGTVNGPALGPYDWGLFCGTCREAFRQPPGECSACGAAGPFETEIQWDGNQARETQFCDKDCLQALLADLGVPVGNIHTLSMS